MSREEFLKMFADTVEVRLRLNIETGYYNDRTINIRFNIVDKETGDVILSAEDFTSLPNNSRNSAWD